MANIPSLCRFCYNVDSVPEMEEIPVCRACGKPGRLVHPELLTLSMAHLDCDAFYAAIEKRDDSSLIDKPVIIGGGARGVVATACYVARTFGVRSAMPMFQALKLCPDAVVVGPNMSKYVQVGRAVRKMMLDLTPLVEPLSIDEAFMDLTGTSRVHGAPPIVTLAKLQTRVENELGVTASIGLSHNKFLAKIASDLDKPCGFSIIGKAETKTFLAKQSVRIISGVGKALAAKLQKDGILTIGQLQKMDASILGKRYGEMGLRLARLSNGQDIRPVKPNRETKSITSETTFTKDISDLHALEDVLWRLCEKVSARMKASNFDGRVVSLKLKSTDFKTVTRRTTLEIPDNLAHTLFSVSKEMLRATVKEKSYRLIGVGYADLSEAGNSIEADLFGEAKERLTAQEKAIDKIRDKFGTDSIGAGRKLRPPRD